MSIPGLVDECVYMSDDGWDYYLDEVYNEYTKSVKNQKCCECNLVIPPLKKHKLYIGIKRGRYEDDELEETEEFRTCDVCDKMIAEFTNGDRNFGVFWDHFEDISGISGPDHDPKDMEDFEDGEDKDRAEYLLGKT